ESLPADSLPFIPALQESLNQREQEILRLVADGLSNRAIAQRLAFSVDTIKWYLKQLYSKLHVHNRLQAVEQARALNLLGSAGPGRPALSPGSAVSNDSLPAVNSAVLENPYKGLRAF